MRVLICGSRTWDDVDAVEKELVRFPFSTMIVHGGCPTGADQIARNLADRLGYTQEIHFADWERHGYRAGPIRNQEMVKSGVDLVIAFKDAIHNHGTDSTIKFAEDAGVPTRIITLTHRA